MTTNRTYDVHFNDEYNSSNKGMKSTIEECYDYIRTYNKSDESYFKDYKGGIVSIVCNEDDTTIYEEKVK